MRTRLAVSLLAILTISATCFAQAVASEADDDFEQGKAGDAVSGWFVPTPTFSATYVEEGAKQGKKCAKLSGKAAGGGFGNLMRTVDATPYREKRIRLTAWVRLGEAKSGKAQMWLREDRSQQRMGFFDNMSDRPVTSESWTKCKIEGAIGPDAESIALGFMSIDGATVLVDDVELRIIGEAKAAPVETARPLSAVGLDNLTLLARLIGVVRYFHPGDQAADADWNAVTVAAVRSVENARNATELTDSLRAVFAPIAPLVQITVADAKPDTATSAPSGTQLVAWKHIGLSLQTDIRSIYRSNRIYVAADARENEAAWMPAPSDPPIKIEFAGVVCTVPITLWANDRKTLPAASQPASATADDSARYTGDDRATRLAAAILAWNVFEHFYPYFDVVNCDWQVELRAALSSAATDKDEREFLATLRRMVAALHDGHGYVSHSSDNRNLMLPVEWDWIENKLVVTFVSDEAKEVAPDIVLGATVESINGRPAIDVIKDAEKLDSAATPQYLRHRALGDLRRVPFGEVVSLDMVSPDGKRAATKLAGVEPKIELAPPRPAHFGEVRPGIRYIDIDRLGTGDIDKHIDELTSAKGVIIDVRGYPGTAEAWALLAHLTGEVIQSPQWHVPVFTRPDRVGVTFERSGWPIQPMKPRIGGKVMFLTDGRAISAAETFMAFVENYKLGEIVGGATAGTNGNVNPITVPGGYHISWTGMKVLRHDGTRHHGVGIVPTVPVSRTIAGVAAGRDEILERAIALIEADK